MKPQPTSITKTNSDQIKIIWKDEHEGIYEIKFLRDECPCASCKGETVLMKSYPANVQLELPGKYDVKNLTVVGSYAIQIFWGDGHDTGIYSFELLRSLCQCQTCSTKN